MSQQRAGGGVRRLGIVSAAAMLACAGLAPAQQPEKSDPLLTGPKVTDRDVPGVRQGFGQGTGELQRRMANRIPPQVLNDALEDLLDEDAAAEIKATPEQAEKIRAIRDDFQKQMRTFQRENREELRELRRQAGEFQRPREGRGNPEGRPQPDEMMSEGGDAALAARERYRVLMEKAPKVEDAQVRVWEILSAKQREHVEGEIQAFREQEEMRRAERYVEERMKGREAGPSRPGAEGAPRRPQAGGPPAGGDDRVSPERRQRLMRLFAALTPEQQDQLLQRLEARLKESGSPNPRRRGAEGRKEGEGKPAPKTEDIRVPDEGEMSNDGREQ